MKEKQCSLFILLLVLISEENVASPHCRLELVFPLLEREFFAFVGSRLVRLFVSVVLHVLFLIGGLTNGHRPGSPLVRCEGFYDHLRRGVLPLRDLLLVRLEVEALELTHLLDLVEVDHEALVLGVLLGYAFAAEHAPMVRTVEVPHSLPMRHTQLLWQHLSVKVHAAQESVSLHKLEKDRNVEWKALWRVEVLHELTTEGAPNARVAEEVCGETRGAKGVPAVHKDAWDASSNVVGKPAKQASVELPRLIVGFDDHWCFYHVF